MNASCPMHWQHATTHCNTLRHTATNYNTLQHTAAHWQQTATHCSTLKHTATHCNTLQHTATHCNALQHAATHCNMLQHTATHCNTLQIFCLACGCLFVGMTLVCMNVYTHTYEPLTPPPPALLPSLHIALLLRKRLHSGSNIFFSQKIFFNFRRETWVVVLDSYWCCQEEGKAF